MNVVHQVQHVISRVWAARIHGRAGARPAGVAHVRSVGVRVERVPVHQVVQNSVGKHMRYYISILSHIS